MKELICMLQYGVFPRDIGEYMQSVVFF
jgi:hypothetical protein